MRLAFDETGNVLTSNGSLVSVKDSASEANRLNMFFSTNRGQYIFDKQFGKVDASLFGKLYTESVEISAFQEKIKDALFLSNLLPGATVSVAQPDPERLTVEINTGDEDILWTFFVKEGRLSKVEREILTAATMVEINYYVKLNGKSFYDINAAFEECRRANYIERESNTLFKYRVYTAAEKYSTDGNRVVNFDINDIDRTLQINEDTVSTAWVRIEMCPSDMAVVEETTNPYLLRK